MPKKLPVLISIPHCSEYVPADIKRLIKLSDYDMRREVDLYTDQIFDVPNAHVVKAKISRAIVDPNRAPDHIEMECDLCAEGVVISVSVHGKPMYKTAPSPEAIFDRVKKYHDTFHAQLEAFAPKAKFFIDGHSMPSIGSVTKPDAGKVRADIVLGNREYTSCSRAQTLKIVEFFEARGYSVKVNDPYKGKYIVGHYCSRRHLPGLQIEVNRKVYMNEKTLKPHVAKIKRLNGYMQELVEMVSGDFS